MDEIKFVKILDGGIADPDPVKLSFGARHRLVWISRASKDYKIEFPGDSPFTQKTFEVPSGEECDPGVIKKTGRFNHDLNEKVLKKAGVVAADPTIIIEQ